MIFAFITALTPTILLALLGVLLTKRTEYLDNPHLGNLVSNIGLPALLLSSVLQMEMDLLGMLSIVAATTLCLMAMAAVAYLCLSFMALSPQFYLSPLVNPNTGNLGIPIAYALFGQEGLTIAVVVSSVVQVSHFTLGVGFMSGRYHPQQLLTNGPVIALLIGVLFLVFEVTVPSPMVDTLNMLSAMTLPIMLLLLGKSLASLNLSDTQTLYRSIVLACFRPVVGTVIAALIVPWFGFSAVQEATIITLQGMSVAVISYMLATKFNGPKDEIALMIMFSIPVSLITAGTVWWLYA